MTDHEWKRLLTLLQRYGETELDQHDHFSVPLQYGRLYVGFTLTPIEAHGERDDTIRCWTTPRAFARPSSQCHRQVRRAVSSGTRPA